MPCWSNFEEGSKTITNNCLDDHTDVCSQYCPYSAESGTAANAAYNTNTNTECINYDKENEGVPDEGQAPLTMVCRQGVNTSLLSIYSLFFGVITGGFILCFMSYWFCFRGKNWWRCCCGKSQEGENYNEMFDGMAGYN